MTKLPNYRIVSVGRKEELAMMEQFHYSRKVVPNSVIKLGAYNGTRLVGVATFGRIINCVPLFDNDPTNRGGLELNRLAMVEDSPKNSESWFLMMCIRLLRRQYPWLQFITTWADGMRCQGGTIYKACGFLYLRKRKNDSLYQLPDGSVIHQIAFDKVYLKRHATTLRAIKGARERVAHVFGGATLLEGYQYHYLHIIDPAQRAHLLMAPQPYEKAPATEQGPQGAASVPAHQDAGTATGSAEVHPPSSAEPGQSTGATPSHPPG